MDVSVFLRPLLSIETVSHSERFHGFRISRKENLSQYAADEKDIRGKNELYKKRYFQCFILQRVFLSHSRKSSRVLAVNRRPDPEVKVARSHSQFYKLMNTRRNCQTIQHSVFAM